MQNEGEAETIYKKTTRKGVFPMKQRTRKSKIFSVLASVGAAAMLLGTAVPTFATDTGWAATLPRFSMETKITNGTISLDGQRYHSLWLYSLKDEGGIYLYVKNNAGTRIGPEVLLPKWNGGMETTVFYDPAQKKGAVVALYGKDAVGRVIEENYATGRVNFG